MRKSSKEWEPELRKIDEDNSELIAFSAMWEVWQDLHEVEKERDEWEKKDESSRESLHSEMIRAERAEADRNTAKENAAYMLKLYSGECDRSLETEARRDKAEASNDRLVASLKVLSKCAKKFQIETDEKKRNGRIWDALYEAIEKADAALAEARKEKV